jgi:hypothetical protein
LFEPLVKLGLSKLDPLIDAYVERQRIILMIAVPGTLLFLLLFWAFSGAGGVMLILGLLLVIAEAVLAGGIFLLHEKYKDEIREWFDAADAIEAFLSNNDVFSEWTQFLATPQEDRRLEQLRINCNNMPREYPPEPGCEYCGQEGLDLLESYVKQLRVGVATKASEDFGKWWVIWRAGREERKGRKDERKAKAAARAESKAEAARAKAEAKAAAGQEPAEPTARKRARSAPVESMPTLAPKRAEPAPEPPRKAARQSKRAAKAASKQARKAAAKNAKRAAAKARTASRSRRAPSPAVRSEAAPGMVTEAAAIQQIMDAGFTAHDFDRKQEQLLQQRGRVPSPGEVAGALMAGQRGPVRKPKGRRAKSRKAAAKVKVRQGAGGVRWMRVFVVLGAVAGAPFAAWRLPKLESKPVAIVGEVHHQLLDRPDDVRHRLRTLFEELFGNRAVTLVNGRRIYVTESDYKRCWPESWDAIYEKNYSLRVTAEARPLYFDDYTVAKITMVTRVDKPMARAR